MTKSSENIFRILVTECQHLAGLGAIRSFGRAGHTVTAAYLGSTDRAPAASSRYIADSHTHPDSWTQQSAFQEWLVDITANEAFDVLLPTSEAAIVACNAVKSDLPPSLTVLAPSVASQKVTLSKFAATRLAQENGIMTPKTLFLGHADSWQQDEFDLHALKFPIVIKSDNCLVSDSTYRKGKTFICEKPEVAVRLLESCRDSPARFIAQEYIPGHGEGVSLLSFKGETRLSFVHERLHEVPWQGGWSSLRKSAVNSQLLEDACRLLGAFDYEGLAMAEFRRGENGKHYFLEINGRLWGSIALALHAGIDFPLAWLELEMTGQTSVVQKPYRAGLTCCNFFPGEIDYLKSVNTTARNGEPGCPSPARARAAFLKLLFNPLLRHDQFWWSDPAPGLAAAHRAMAGKIKRMLIPGLERLQLKALRERGPLRFAAMLVYGSLYQALSMRNWIQSRHQLHRMKRVRVSLGEAKRVLFLCYGNICRSPFAAEYWNDQLKALGIAGPMACSAGYHPEVGRLTPAAFRKIAHRFGVNLGLHRSSLVTHKLIDEADLVFVMDAENHAHIARTYPQAIDKTFFLGLMTGKNSLFIPDPYGRSRQQVLDCYKLMKSSLDSALNMVLEARRKPAFPLRIFMFHAVLQQAPDIHYYCFLHRRLFRQQLELISRYFDVLPLSEAVLKLKAGELTKPTAAITFDDGFHNNYSVAFPELKRLGLRATIFVSTGFVDTDQALWFCRVLRAVSESPLSSMDWDGQHYELSAAAEKSNTARMLMAELKKMPQDMLESEVDTIERLLGFEARVPVDPDSPYRMLSSAAIREMAASGLVEYGGHTHSHAVLSRLTAAEQGREILTSIDSLRRLLQRPCKLFAYPNGTRDDYDETSIEWLQKSEVPIALTAVGGSNQWFEHPLELHRESLGPSDNEWKLERRIRWMIQTDKAATCRKVQEFAKSGE